MKETQLQLGLPPEERPKPYKDQVLDISEIKIGQTYIAVNKNGSRRHLTVLSQPHTLEYLSDFEGQFIDVEDDTSAVHAKYPEIVPPTQKTIISLADHAVVSYENGNWNKHNYLLKKPKPSESL